MGADIQYLAENGRHAAKNRPARKRLFELNLSHSDVSISIGEPDLKMGIDSVGSGAGIKGDPA